MKQQANKTKKINMTIDFVAPIEDKMQTCIIPAFLYYKNKNYLIALSHKSAIF